MLMSERQSCLVHMARKRPCAAVCQALEGVLVLSLGRQAGSRFLSLCKFPPLCSARCLPFVLGKVVLDPRYSTLLYFTLSPFLSVGLLRRLGYVPSLFSTSSGTHIVASGPARYRCCSQPL